MVIIRKNGYVNKKNKKHQGENYEKTTRKHHVGCFNDDKHFLNRLW